MNETVLNIDSCGLNDGDTVKVVSCNSCPAVVGRTAKITGINQQPETNVVLVRVSFGKGRPQKGRPDTFTLDQLELVERNVVNIDVQN
jgi:hypothetical protein